MKKLVTLFTLLLAVALQAAPVAKFPSTADLNVTLSDLIARYGVPVKAEKAWYGAGVSYGFQPSKSQYVWATTDPSTSTFRDVIYFRFDPSWKTVPFTKAEQKEISGLQKGAVGNVRKVSVPEVKGELVGYQVRTPSQVKLERPSARVAKK